MKGMNANLNRAMGKAEVPANRVLVVDDEAEIADLVVHLLEREGLSAQAAYSGTSALELFADETYSLVVLDIMMPGLDGWGVCRKLRETSDVPIVFLSAKDEEFDKVMGLTLGADDYISKPFRPRELVARVKAHLRRSRLNASAKPAQASMLTADDLTMNTATHEAFVGDEPISFTPKEFDILAALLRAGGEPVSTRELFESIWNEPYDASAGNTVMVHIRRLRKKLAERGVPKELIETVWGIGYKVKARFRS